MNTLSLHRGRSHPSHENAINILQECCQKNPHLFHFPSYRTSSNGEDHQKHWFAECMLTMVNGVILQTSTYPSWFKTCKEAKKVAAALMIDQVTHQMTAHQSNLAASSNNHAPTYTPNQPIQYTVGSDNQGVFASSLEAQPPNQWSHHQQSYGMSQVDNYAGMQHPACFIPDDVSSQTQPQEPWAQPTFVQHQASYVHIHAPTPVRPNMENINLSVLLKPVVSHHIFFINLEDRPKTFPWIEKPLDGCILFGFISPYNEHFEWYLQAWSSWDMQAPPNLRDKSSGLFLCSVQDGHNPIMCDFYMASAIGQISTGLDKNAPITIVSSNKFHNATMAYLNHCQFKYVNVDLEW